MRGRIAHGLIGLVLTLAYAVMFHPDVLRHDVPFTEDDHARWALDVALVRASCGKTGFGPRHVRVGGFLMTTEYARRVPLRQVAAGLAGSKDAFCEDADVPFVQNESSLQTLEATVLRLRPNVSLVQLGRVFVAVQLAAIAIFVFAAALVLRNAAAAALFGALAVWTRSMAVVPHWYSIYPFFVPLLLGAIGLFSLLLPAVRRARAGRLAAALLATGAYLAFAGNMRTSHIPIYATLALTFCAAAWRLAGRRAAALGLIAMATGYASYHYFAVSRTQHLEAAPGINAVSYHVIAHPLVLGVALPPSDFARSLGLAWDDVVGYRLGQRLDPDAPYLSREYDAALFRYYGQLWRSHPREMMNIYLEKARIAGHHLVRQSRIGSLKLPRVIELALVPYDWLPGRGLGMLALFVAVSAAAFAWFLRTADIRYFLIAALMTVVMLMQIEAIMIVPYFSMSYHLYYLFILPGFWVLAAHMGGSLMTRFFRGSRDQAAAASLQQRTIADFGEQWTEYRDNEGYYGSAALFNDVFGPLLSADAVRDRRVAEIGAGTGRFINIFAEHGAAHVVALEPSAAFDVLKANTASNAARVAYLRLPGDRLPADLALDYVFSIGVLHHIPDPAPVVRAAHGALEPGGTIAIWVYGREGNAAYLAVANTLRLFTRALPHRMLEGFVRVIDVPAVAYIKLCRVLPLPLAKYMTEVLGRLTGDKRRLVIYDQLNPAYAKYYRREEVERLLTDAGFTDLRLYHRHGYSWAATARKP